MFLIKFIQRNLQNAVNDGSFQRDVPDHPVKEVIIAGVTGRQDSDIDYVNFQSISLRLFTLCDQ